MPAGTLAGKIQRGLGSGFLEALEQPRSEVEPIVLGCLADDPRVNAQDENRDLYYARLMLELGIDESRVGTILARDPDRDGMTTRDWLPVGVLGLLARSGRPESARILRDYISSGLWWSEALYHLSATGDPAALDGLDAVLARRFADDPDELASETGPWDEEPWRSWGERGPLETLAPVVEAKVDQPSVDLDALDARRLFGRVTGFGWRADPATDLLVARIRGGSTTDRRGVEDALRGQDRCLAALAVRVLGALGDPAIVPVGEQILMDIEDGFAVPGRLRPVILRGFEGLPSVTALEVARRWRDTSDYRGTVVATSLLALHATLEDLSWTVESIRRAAANDDDLYVYARILPRFPGTGPFDGFEEIYRTYVPTCCRGHLIAAMSVADPTFGDTLAMECLYDCEPITREAAARTVTLTPDTRLRLCALADDPLEEDEVRTAASARLA